MLRFIVRVGLLCIMPAVGAHAADLAGAPTEPMASVVVPYNWTGAHVGGHIGYGFGTTDTEFSRPNFPVLAGVRENQDYHLDGFFGGAQAGYDYQIGSFVIGVAADISAARFRGHSDEIEEGNGNFYDTKIRWLGTLRTRIGYAFDHALIYATGGLAFGSVDNRYIYGPSDPGLSVSEKKTQTGWAIGGGLEYALTDHWSATIEYLHVDLGGQTIVFDESAEKFKNASDSVNLGVNYRF